MTFQEILEGIARHRANGVSMSAKVAHSGGAMVADVSDDEILRKINEIEWALQALAETLRDREQELKACVPFGERNEVDEAFDEYEKRE